MDLIKETLIIVYILIQLFSVEVDSKTDLESVLTKSLFSSVPPYIKFPRYFQNISDKVPEEIKHYLRWEPRTRFMGTVTDELSYVQRILKYSGIEWKRKNETIEWFGGYGARLTRNPELLINIMKNRLKGEFQKTDPISGYDEIDNKIKQLKNAKKFVKTNNLNLDKFIPMQKSFAFPEDKEKFKKVWEKLEDKRWLIKPPDGVFGKGIKTFDNISDIENITTSSPVLVQKLLTNPLCNENGQQIELRFHVLVTSVEPLRIYLTYTGTTYFRSSRFLGHPRMDPVSVDNKAGFEKLFDEATKFEMKEIIKSSIICSFLSIEKPLRKKSRFVQFNRYNSYQLFSFDYLVDTDKKLYLLQINRHPVQRYSVSNS